MMSLTLGLCTRMSDSGPHGPLVCIYNLVAYNIQLYGGTSNVIIALL